MKDDLDLIIKKYKSGRREDLIPLLQEIQESRGFLSEEVMVQVGKFLGLSTTKIFGLATFYDSFRFVPGGKLHIVICNGTSCFLNGSESLISKMNELTGLKPGETSRDGSISYEIVSCMGGCHNGPVISTGGEYYTHVKADRLPDLIKKLKYVIEND